MKESTLKHIENLKALGFCGDYEAFVKLERRAHRFMEHCCNVPVEEKREEQARERLKIEAAAFFKDHKLPEGFFLNGDPRGYTFKIKYEVVREKKIKITTDWGGYGILCPDEE